MSEEKKRKLDDVSKAEAHGDNKSHMEMFAKAVECGFLSNVKTMIEEGKVTNVNAIPQQPILLKCVKDTEMTQYLLSQGAQITAHVVQQAIQHGITTDVLELFLTKDPKLADDALLHAVAMRHFETAIHVMEFVKSTTTGYEWSPSTLDDAMFRMCQLGIYGVQEGKMVELFERLIQNGGNVDAKRNNRTLTQVLVETKSRSFQSNNTLEILDLLMIHKADISGAIHVAAGGSRLGLVNFLLKHVDVNERDKDGNTPLHFARNKFVAIALVKSGADLMATNDNGDVAMQQVCALHSVEEDGDVCQSLLLAELNRSIQQIKK